MLNCFGYEWWCIILNYNLNVLQVGGPVMILWQLSGASPLIIGIVVFMELREHTKMLSKECEEKEKMLHLTIVFFMTETQATLASRHCHDPSMFWQNTLPTLTSCGLSQSARNSVSADFSHWNTNWALYVCSSSFRSAVFCVCWLFCCLFKNVLLAAFSVHGILSESF